MRIRFAHVLAAAALLATTPLAAAHASTQPTTYADAAYRTSDLDTIQRSLERQTSELTTAGWDRAFVFTAAESWLLSQSRALGDLGQDRAHITLGSILPGGAVGQPLDYGNGTFTDVTFLSRTGAKIYGRIWGADGTKPKPGVVITPGSIQGTQEMYWWFARTLAANGYEVLTWDAQGQGQSETMGHAFGSPAPSTAGVPFQQLSNFDDGTVDALRFFMSTPAKPYDPLPRTAAEVAAAKALAASDGDRLLWTNPGSAVLDRTRLGIVGHSLGAEAVSEVQQCSDAGTAWRTVPLCQGTSFPIKAVVAWDALSSAVIPVVPALDEEADGYFLNPQPAPTAPDPHGHLAAEQRWAKVGVDTMALTVRGGVHTEWAVYPLISLGTAYGTKLADYYSLAWLDRYVKGDLAATGRIVRGISAVAPGTPDPAAVAWNAHHFSVRYLSAWHLHLGGHLIEQLDLRKAAGLSAVADWIGANADTEGAYQPAAISDIEGGGHGDGATALSG